MNEEYDLGHAILFGEKALPLLFKALECRFGGRFIDVDTDEPLTGAEILAACLIEILETGLLQVEMIREAKRGKGPEGYRFLSLEDGAWVYPEVARDNFAIELEKGGDLRISPVLSTDDGEEDNWFRQ